MNKNSKFSQLSGALVYEGPSEVDGSPIFAAFSNLLRPSTNSKTGEMPQLWILPQKGTGKITETRSVCGACPAESWCYVDRSLLSNIIRAYQSGSYSRRPEGLYDALDFSPYESVRYGAFGNLSALPVDTLKAMFDAADRAKKDWTAYEQHWKILSPTKEELLKSRAMASVSTIADAVEAYRRGWTFYLASLQPEADMLLLKKEYNVPTIRCPHDVNKRVRCSTCLLCNGMTKPGIVALLHGPLSKINHARKSIEQRLRVLS